MKLRPVKRADGPKYPTKAEVVQRPELLGEHVPGGWKAGGVAGALALFLAANLSGCQSKESATSGGAGTAGTGGESPRVETADQKGSTRHEAVRAVVAPVFEHGEGRGAVGCMVMSPPVFLSEEEALAVIRDEMAKSGIELTPSTSEMKEVRLVPVRNAFWEGEMGETNGAARPLKPDLADAKRHVVVEYVSQEDHDELSDGYGGSSVGTMDTRKVAESVAAKVSEKGRGVYFGVFYDPLSEIAAEDRVRERKVSAEDYWEVLERRGADRSKELLRQQVRDFAAWLKAQGVSE